MAVRRFLVTVLLSLLLGLTGWPGSRASGQTASRVRLYMMDQPFTGKLLPLDPTTLADMRDAPDIQVAGVSAASSIVAIVPSRNGAVFAAVSYAANDLAHRMTIRIVDARTGRERARFHPALSFFVSGVSNDGSQVYGPGNDNSRLPFVTWYVLSGTGGRVLYRMSYRDRCCSATLYDPARHRLYEMGVPAVDVYDQHKPLPAALVAYDLVSRREIAQVRLPGVLAGAWQTRRMVDGYPVYASWQPGFALSPDGRRLAVLDGSQNILTLIDTRTLKIVRSEELGSSQSLLKRLGAWLDLVPAVALAKAEEGVSLSMTFSPDGQRLYVTGWRDQVGQHRTFTSSSLGARVVDVASGRIVAQAAKVESIWLVSPDGSAVYTGDPVTGNACPCMLRRRDPVTLQVTAERTVAAAVGLYALAAP